jgi:hypothetical protein
MTAELWTLDELAGWPDDDDGPAVITEADLDDGWKAADLTEMDEFDYDEWAANACCPDRIAAARSFCGCGGSGELPSWVRRNWEAVA